jgi:hypothetical protein
MTLVLGQADLAQAADDRGWLGIYTDPVRELPSIEARAGGTASLRGATCGLRVTAVFPESPADEGGLLLGDVIISVFEKPFTCAPESVSAVFRRSLEDTLAGTPCPLLVIRDAVTREMTINGEDPSASVERRFWRQPETLIEDLQSGESLAASASKQQEVLELPVVLGLRPEARWPEPLTNLQIYPPGRFAQGTYTSLFWSLARRYRVREDTADLLDRLERCHSGSDPLRLNCMIYVHRDPFRTESVSRRIVDILASSQGPRGSLESMGPFLVHGHGSTMPPGRRLKLRPGPGLRPESPLHTAPRQRTGVRRGAQPILDQITRILSEAEVWHRRAFAQLTEEDRSFLSSERWNLSDVFAEDIYIHFDEDVDRFGKNKRILDLAQEVDYGALLEAASRVALLTDPDWALAVGHRLREIYADSLDAEILVNRETPFGRILIGGTSRRWYRETDAAFIIDLGGDDFYSGNVGGSSGWEVPLSVCIDLAGDDAYESTEKSCQGTGCLGVGGLLDLSGNDTYIGNQWCQGTGYLGIGWIHDLEGDDTYRGRTFCQGVGLFGIGLLMDGAGNDRYEGDGHVQALGLAKGIGALVDHSGDDEYYAKGLYPTGYGDAGIFDSWSQGCGLGFRTLGSGGLGVLVDGSGVDRMEAGNFSQGGGYYYGYGILAARGPEGDLYIGSRYNQGFCAHQAVGVFLEEGGDDIYTTRQGVAQGLAWDECVTIFVDESGDDVYQGGRFFSQGASAHNSVCIFLEKGGRDTYDYDPGQARAGGNSYHGGTSYSLFIDEGDDVDHYSAEDSANNTMRHKPEHGFFIDGRGKALGSR